MFRLVAGDDGGVDGTDGDAGHPVGLKSSLVQGLIDASLIGPERAAALQDEADTVDALGAGSGSIGARGLRSGVRGSVSMSMKINLRKLCDSGLLVWCTTEMWIPQGN